MPITKSLTWNPLDPESVAEAAREFLTDNERAVLTAVVIDRIRAVLADASDGRRDYLRVVAEASPLAPAVDDIVAAVGGSGSVGPVHARLEEAWRAAGGTGRMVATPARMDSALAVLVLEVINGD